MDEHESAVLLLARSIEHTPMIASLLIANRGDIASRIIRTAREMGVRTGAVYSDADAKAPLVRMEGNE